MKTIYRCMTTCMISIVILLSSCTKSLDVKPTSVITNNSFWQTEDDAKGALTGMYVKLRNQALLNLFIWGEARSEVMEWGAVSGTLDYDRFYNNTLNSTSAGSGSDWLGMYTCVNAANLIIKYVPGISFTSEPAKNNILAQAYAMRAFTYFVLAKTWGDLPLRTEPIEGYSPETIQKERAHQEEVFKLIKDDIEKAIGLFSNNMFPPGRNRWSQAAVQALKADVYLWTGKRLNGGDADFTTAITACDEVDKANVGLLPEFADIFKYTNKGNKEVLMAVGEKEQESTNNYFYNMYSAAKPTMVDPATGEIIGQTAGGMVWTVTKLVRDQFSTDDKRRNASFMEIDSTAYIPPLILKGRGILMNGIRYYTSDMILYRYADVLLMKAEAKNALGQDPSEEMNKIRQRAFGDNYNQHVFVSGSKAENDDKILQERLLELVFEGKRWWDVVRFGKAFDLVPSLKSRAGNDYLLLFPISRSTLSLEPKIKQNPGY